MSTGKSISDASRIVIVGAGFGGLNAAKGLAGQNAHITIVDRKNHHTFQPLLYQVATAGLSPGEIAAPIRWIFRGRDNVEVLLEEVVGFDLDRRLVKTSEQELPYNYLVVAAGASHAYFGHDDWEVLAPGLIDMLVFSGEPGHEHAGLLESELAAAVAGGVTSLVCPPDTDPVLDEPGSTTRRLVPIEANASSTAERAPSPPCRG